MASITLEPITEHNVHQVFELEVHPNQTGFVADNPRSLAQALAEYDIAWPRAITVDDRPVGFLMLEIDPEEENGRPFWLWRLMIAGTDQGHGYGWAALELAVDEVRRRGGTELYTSWVEGDGGPEPFYRKFGFEPTGEIDDEEVVACLEIRQQS